MMIRKFMSALAVAGILVATPTLAAPTSAGQCKDAKGKFINCQNASKKTVSKTVGKAPAKSTATKSNVVKDKNGKCRYASGAKKGQFAKC